MRFRKILVPLLWLRSLGTLVDGHLAGLQRQHVHRVASNLALLGELPDLARKLLGLSCDFWCKPGSLIRCRAAFSKSLAKPLISQLANCALSQSSAKAGPLDMAKLEKARVTCVSSGEQRTLVTGIKLVPETTWVQTLAGKLKLWSLLAVP